MVRIARRIGIAIGSLVIAYLAVTLVVGVLFGASVSTSPILGLVIVVLGGLVFVDIVRGERPADAVTHPSRGTRP